MNKKIASAMICEKPRIVEGRVILSAYDGVWAAVEDIPIQLKSYVTDDLGNRDALVSGAGVCVQRLLHGFLTSM